MKTCKAEGCVRPVFSHGFCQSHQRQRTDDKYNRTYKANRGIPKYTKKEKIQDFNFGFESQLDLFAWLWQEAKDKNGIVICPYTNERLNCFYNTEQWLSCFAHILPKGRYTYFRTNPKNVAVCHPDFHHIVDQGTSLDRANHPTWKFEKWDQRKEEMKIQYQLFKKQNLLA
jgi:hypothetical protein